MERILAGFVVGGGAQHRAVGGHGEGPTVEDQFILAAHLVDVDHRNFILPGALGHQPLALDGLATMKGRGVEVENQRRPGLLRPATGLSFPDILANTQAHRDTPYVYHTGLRTRGKIAFFIEDLVVRQALLGVFRQQLTVVDYARHVVELAVEFPGVTYHRIGIAHLGTEPGQRRVHPSTHTRPQQQVLGRVTTEGQLREHQHRAVVLRLGALHRGQDLVDIAVKIPHQGIELHHDNLQLRHAVLSRLRGAILSCKPCS